MEGEPQPQDGSKRAFTQAASPSRDQMPFQSEVTVIWKEEKQELHDRLKDLEQRVQALEAWALQVRPNR
jgi:polyhydroxyalkanoate synthesis regulator phasin